MVDGEEVRGIGKRSALDSLEFSFYPERLSSMAFLPRCPQDPVDRAIGRFQHLENRPSISHQRTPARVRKSLTKPGGKIY
jgi:hypothetical protein